MSKIVKIKENSLLKLKEIATNKNVGSKNTIAVNEAKPDVDEYEIGQESDNPPIGGNYCHVSENMSFNTSEEKYDVIKLAIENFGITTVLKESGYILPNGSLLKFGNNGSRDIDHRGIEIIYLKNNIPIWNNEYRYNYVVDFMNHGAIRCCLNGGILDMTQQPTREQYSVIATFVRKAVDIDIDFTDNKGNVIHSVSYTDAKPQQVITDIYYFYNEGIKPQGNVRYENKNNKKNLLTESQESKSIAAAKKLVMQRLNYNEQQADEFIRIKLRNDLPILRTPQGGKFILGATRMFCNGELRSANDIGNLNSTLKLIASDAHINEYDRNLNGMSYQELIQRFSKAMSDNLEAEKAEIGQMVFDTHSDYEIIRIDSFGEAKKYGRYTSWCVTHDESMFDSYTHDGVNQFYFCLKNGFENVERQPSDGCPLDDYGLSMIAVSVNENGMLNTCTCRWNHDNGGDDSIMNSKELSQVIGMNFFDVFRPNNKWKEVLSDVMQRLANGESIEDVFDDYGDFSEGFAWVELNGKWNFLTKEGRLLSNQWFDLCGDFCEGFATVELNGKLNFINQDGKYLSNQWFDECGYFHEGFAKVALNEKWNFISKEGRLLSDQWFDNCSYFREGFAAVELNEKWNFINQECKFLSNQWFDRCYYFREGFAKVELDGKWNFINQECKFLSDQWFDGCDDFHEEFAKVALNEKWNFVTKEGRLLSDQWFDDCGYFYEGFAAVKLNEKWNFINQEGKILSDQWFNDCDDFRDGFAMVKLNKKWNFINQEGRYLSNQWFDRCDNFRDGFARVKLNGRYNILTKEGWFLSNQWFDECSYFREGFAWVKLNGRYNFLTKEGKILSNQWFDGCNSFHEGFAKVVLNARYYRIDTNGNLTLDESKSNSKNIMLSESQLKILHENLNIEVDSSEIDLSSFKKKTSLAPNIWDDNDTLNSRVRLRLLDIADDFWKFVNLSWVKPKGIILTGSICNFNWSHYSDIDLHLIVDFKEVDEKTEFVKDYLDAKKNEWNETHSGLKIYDFQIELYVQDVNDELDASGVYDLKDNKWIIKPNQDSVKPIGLNKFNIKKKAAEIMTIIDDMYDALHSTNDSHEIESIGDDAKYLWTKLKSMRKSSLRKEGESGSGNIVWKYLRRKEYLNKLWHLSNIVYDRVNSITEGKNKKDSVILEDKRYDNDSIKKYLKLLKEFKLNEEWVTDGNAEHNPYAKRWKAERQALKNFICNYGKLMQSKESNKEGRVYKVFYDQGISNLIGFNYGLCVQWDMTTNRPKSTVYIRAIDRFTPNIRQNIQYDSRGIGNQNVQV